jgi:hypothetical protein
MDRIQRSNFSVNDVTALLRFAEYKEDYIMVQ